MDQYAVRLQSLVPPPSRTVLAMLITLAPLLDTLAIPPTTSAALWLITPIPPISSVSKSKCHDYAVFIIDQSAVQYFDKYRSCYRWSLPYWIRDGDDPWRCR